MNTAMHELTFLLSDYYIAHSQYADQSEKQAIYEAGDQGLVALSTLCHQLWGTRTCEVYLAILTTIREYDEFILENREVSSIWNAGDMDAIPEYAHRHMKVADYICTMWRMETSDTKDAHTLACVRLKNKIYCIANILCMPFGRTT